MWFFNFFLPSDLSKMKACLLQAYVMQVSDAMFHTWYFVLGTWYYFSKNSMHAYKFFLI